jgi:ATP-dependent DNA helicase PIF1
MTQDEALAILESGKSVLLTGAAGAGKTYVLNKFIKRARQQGKSIAVTATTGLAATHLNGTTIHAWSGIGVSDFFDKRQAGMMGKQRQELIKKGDVLIIDEVSMLHDFRLDMVDDTLRYVRGSSEPFGGMQVVLCGDFFQLPPINRSGSRAGSFVTSSVAWGQNVFTVCYLHTQFRQIQDSLYTDILNGIRAGVLTRSQLDTLQSRSQAVDDPFTPRTRLLTVNVDVDGVNHKQLDELDGEKHVYEMETHGGKQYVEQLQRSCLAPQTLRLKLGAQVMCIKNSQERKYVNGSLGKVVGFEGHSDYPVVELTNGREVTIKPDTWELVDGDKKRASLVQFPLRLAWAITVHKSQGMTLDAARIDLSRAFLILDGLNGMALRVSPLAKEIDVELRAKSDAALLENATYLQTWHEEEQSGEHERQAIKASEIPSADPALYEALQKWRSALATELGKPPYIIASNATLERVAAVKPQTEAQLLDVPGFGAKKVETYGPDIYAIVKTEQDKQ